MRSSSGPLSLLRWRLWSAVVHSHAWFPRPHGHGFVAATSMKLVGSSAARCPRTIVTCRSSSGWRSASSADRANSDSSSRNRTP